MLQWRVVTLDSDVAYGSIAGSPNRFNYECNRDVHNGMVDALGGKSYLEGKNILDIGCAYTLLKNHIEDGGISIKRYVGIECNSDLIGKAKSHFPDVEIVEAAFPFLKEEQRSFLISCGFDVAFMSVFLRSVNVEMVYEMVERAAEFTKDMVIFDRYEDMTKIFENKFNVRRMVIPENLSIHVVTV